MPPSMQFHPFLQPLVASLQESECLGFRPKIALRKLSAEEKRQQKRKAKLAAVDTNALHGAMLRKERELAQLNSVVDWVRQAVQERQEWLVASGTIKEVGAVALALPASPERIQAGGWAPTLSARGRAEMRTHHRVQAALEAAELAAANVRASLTSGPQATLTHEESDENFALEYGLPLRPGPDDDPYGGGYDDVYEPALPSPETSGLAPRRALSHAPPPTRALSHAAPKPSLSESTALMAAPHGSGQAARKGGARSADPAVVAELRRAFDLLDANGNGVLSRAEIILAARRSVEVRRLLGLPSQLRQEDGSRAAFEQVCSSAALA